MSTTVIQSDLDEILFVLWPIGPTKPAAEMMDMLHRIRQLLGGDKSQKRRYVNEWKHLLYVANTGMRPFCTVAAEPSQMWQ